MNMSNNIQSSSALSEIPCDDQAMCETEISPQHEDETDACLSKTSNSISVNAESASTPQPASLARQEDVFFGNSKRNIASRHHTDVAEDTDGGWGWVIVFAVFCITSVIGGVVFSFSLLYLEFVDMFDASRAVAGFIGSLHLFTSHILGNSNSYLFFINCLLY